MAETVQITLIAKDGTTQVFKAAGQAAERMGDQVEDAGTKGAAATDKLGDSAKTSTKNWDEFGRVAGTAAAAIGLASVKLAGDADVAGIALKRNYGDAADEFERLAELLQDKTVFSNDDAIKAANTAATLAKNYGLTNDQIETLVTRSADLASLYGTSLSEAVQRTSSAIRGEAESAEMLGLTMNDTALGIDNLSKSTTDAEKAQIRFTALMDQSATAQGAAGEVAELNSQRWKSWANEANDALQGVGGNLSDFQGPLLALGAASQVIGPLGDAFGALGGKAKTAQLGSAALGLALGPAGLVLAAGAAAAGIYYLTTRESDAEKQAQALAAATDDYTASLQNNTTALLAAGAFDTATGTAAYLETIIANGKTAQDRIDALAESQQFLLGMTSADAEDPSWMRIDGLDAYTQSVLAASDANGDFLISAEEYAAAQATLSGGFEANAGQAATLTDALNALDEVIANPEFAGQDIAKAADAIVREVGAGTITLEEGVAKLDALGSTGLDQYNLAWREHKVVVDANAAAYENFEARRGQAISGMVTENAAIDGQIERRDRMIASLASEADEATATGRAVEIAERGKQAARQASAESLESHRDADLAAQSATGYDRLTASIAKGAEGAARYRVETDALIATQAEAAATALAQGQAVLAATQAYAGMIGTTNALDAGVSVVIGGLENLGGGVERVSTALDGLTTAGEDGGLSQLKQLADDGRISWMEYESAMGAASDATVAATSTQASLGVILANQAPLLADLAAGQADYVAGLADLSAEEQLLALAYMDSANAGKALELQTLAISAANGELGEGGMAFAEDVIAGAAQWDPILKATLLDMGTISEGADGTITVNMAGDGVSEIEALNTTLQQLAGSFEVMLNVDINDDGVIGYVPPELPPATVNVNADASGADATVNERIAAWGGLTATPALNANTAPGDQAVSGAVTTWGSMAATPTIYANTAPADNAVANSVASANGQAATITIDAYTGPYYANLPVTGQTIGTNYIDVVSRGAGQIGFTPFATGGLVTARMGEVGPESVTIPGSNMRAIAPRDGLYTVPDGSYVSSAVATRGMGGGGGGMNFTGATIYVVASTPDIHDALNGQLLAQGRR